MEISTRQLDVVFTALSYIGVALMSPLIVMLIILFVRSLIFVSAEEHQNDVDRMG